MVVMNTANEERTIELSRFSEMTKGFLIGKDILSTGSRELKDTWKIPAMTCWVLELK
jgi:hypothetical protein